MIDLFLKLLDYVVKLAGIRESNRREYFDRYVQPAYETAELIYKDYCSMLSDLRDKVEHSETSEPIIRLLEERRRELLAARTRLRALISERVNEGRATRFEVGILGLMSGVVTSVDRPYFQIYSYVEADGGILPQLGRHTVLDILRKLKRRGSDDISAIRAKLLNAIDDKMRGIEEAWQNVVAGYAELHAGTLPPTAIRFRPKTRQLAGISEIQSLLTEIHDMLDSDRFDRKMAIDFEQRVAEVLPQLSPIARDVREIIHDLDNKEPNVNTADLEDSVMRFEQELDDILRKRS
jgi:hypothetical protein